MALIGTLTVSATAFEITKEKFDGFQQTDLAKEGCVQKLFCLIQIKVVFQNMKDSHVRKFLGFCRLRPIFTMSETEVSWRNK